MAQVIAYQVEIDGLRTAITNQEQLTQAVKDTRAEFKRAEFGTREYQRLNRQLGELQELQKGIRADTRNAGKQMVEEADRGKRSYRALSAELSRLRNEFKDLSQAERRGRIGQDLTRQIQALDKELKDIDAGIGQFQRNVGNYEKALQGLGGSITDLISSAGIGGAFGAIATLGIEGAQAIQQLVAEINETRRQVRQLTGETGAAADAITVRVQAIADTFGEDYNEVLLAANALTKQLTGDFQESFRLIEEGLLSGANANGEFFDTLREYPAFFREIGASGEQFISVISQSVQEGVFSDKGVDLIKEFNIRVREMPKATAEAFEAIGLDSNRVADVIEREGVAAAFQLTQDRLNELRENSPEVGQALADIFGGPGEDAGIRFIKTVDLSRDALDRMAGSADNLTNRQRIALQVNQEYAEANVRLAQTLEGAGGVFVGFGRRIKTFAIDALSDFIIQVRAVIETVQNILSGEFRAVTAFEIIARDAARATEEQAKFQQATEGAESEADNLEKTLNRYRTTTVEAAAATDQFARNSIAGLRERVKELRAELERATPEDQEGALIKLIDAEKELQRAEDLSTELRNRLTTERQGIPPLELIQPDREIEVAREVSDEVTEIVRQRNERLAELERQRAEQTRAIQTETFSAIGQATRLLGDVSNDIFESQIRQVEQRFAREIELAEGNADRQAELEQQLESERERLRRESFQQQKKFRVATALTSLAEGIVNILSAPTTIPDPFGAVFKTLRIGLLTATTARQIAAINQQAAARGTIVEGEARGATHRDASRGIPINVAGKRVLIEHGERLDRDEFGATAIINKRSAARYRPTLRAIYGSSFPGKRRLLSEINARGGGVRFAQAGAIIQPDVSSIAQGTTTSARVTTNLEASIDRESIEQLAAASAQGIRVGAREGVAQGVQDANRRAEREARLAERTGLE